MTQTTQLNRKEREKIRHKEEIMKAALKLFSEKGFHNVSMQDIANQSEFAVGTLYNFFPSKEQLSTELFNNCAEKFYQLLWPTLTDERPEDEKIRNLIRVYSRLAEDNIEFIRLYASQYGTLTFMLPHNEKAEKFKLIIDAKIEDTIKSGIEKKIFRPGDPKIITLAITATIRALILESSINFNKTDMERELKKIEQLFLDTLLMPGESK